MRLVDDEECSRPSGELPKRLMEALVGQHDPDVRQGRLREHACDIAGSECLLERLDVVELDDLRRGGGIDGRTDVAGASADHPIGAERREGLVHGAVVAVVEDEDLPALGDLSREADDEPVGVRGRDRELPVRQAEPPSELLTNRDRILRRKHQRHASNHAVLDRRYGSRR